MEGLKQRKKNLILEIIEDNNIKTFVILIELLIKINIIEKIIKISD